MQQVSQVRVAEDAWCDSCEGDAQAAKLAEWDSSPDRTEEINGFLADPQLNDANCFDVYKTKPHKRPIGGKRGDADEDEEQDDEDDDEDDEGESDSSAAGRATPLTQQKRAKRQPAGLAGQASRGGRSRGGSAAAAAAAAAAARTANPLLDQNGQMAYGGWPSQATMPSYLLPPWLQHPAMMNNHTMLPPPPPPPPPPPTDTQRQRALRNTSPLTGLFDEALSDLPPPPPPPPAPPVISQGELQARVAAATAEAQLSELRASRTREDALLQQLMETKQQHVGLLVSANMQQAGMSTSQLAAADAAAARSAQLAHSAIQGTLAAQLVAASSTDDPAAQSKISRLVGQIGSKELAPPSLAIEPPPGLTEEHNRKRDHTTMALGGRDDGASGASHGLQLALPNGGAGAATAGGTGPSAATGAERLGGPPPRFCSECGFEWAGPTAMFCSACGWKRP